MRGSMRDNMFLLLRQHKVLSAQFNQISNEILKRFDEYNQVIEESNALMRELMMLNAQIKLLKLEEEQ